MFEQKRNAEVEGQPPWFWDLAKYGDPELSSRKTSELRVKAKRFDRWFLELFCETRPHYLWGTLNHLLLGELSQSEALRFVPMLDLN